MGARPQLKPWGNYCWKKCTPSKHRLRLTESTATLCQRKTKVSLPKLWSSIYIAIPDKHDFDSQLLCADWHNLACSGITVKFTKADLKKSVGTSWQWVQVSSHILSYHFVFTGVFCRAQPQPSLPSVTVCKGGLDESQLTNFPKQDGGWKDETSWLWTCCHLICHTGTCLNKTCLHSIRASSVVFSGCALLAQAQAFNKNST